MNIDPVRSVAWGRKSDGPFNHETGRGWVQYQRGHYFDALRKHSRVVPVIIEATGGITPHTCASPHGVRGFARQGCD